MCFKRPNIYINQNAADANDMSGSISKHQLAFGKYNFPKCSNLNISMQNSNSNISETGALTRSYLSNNSLPSNYKMNLISNSPPKTNISSALNLNKEQGESGYLYAPVQQNKIVCLTQDPSKITFHEKKNEEIKQIYNNFSKCENRSTISETDHFKIQNEKYTNKQIIPCSTDVSSLNSKLDENECHTKKCLQDLNQQNIEKKQLAFINEMINGPIRTSSVPNHLPPPFSFSENPEQTEKHLGVNMGCSNPPENVQQNLEYSQLMAKSQTEISPLTQPIPKSTSESEKSEFDIKASNELNQLRKAAVDCSQAQQLFDKWKEKIDLQMTAFQTHASRLKRDEIELYEVLAYIDNLSKCEEGISLRYASANVMINQISKQQNSLMKLLDKIDEEATDLLKIKNKFTPQNKHITTKLPYKGHSQENFENKQQNERKMNLINETLDQLEDMVQILSKTISINGFKQSEDELSCISFDKVLNQSYESLVQIGEIACQQVSHYEFVELKST